MSNTKLYVVLSSKKGQEDKLEGVFTHRLFAQQYIFEVEKDAKSKVFMEWKPYILQGEFIPGKPVYVAWGFKLGKRERLSIDSIHSNEQLARQATVEGGRVDQVVPNSEILDFS